MSSPKLTRRQPTPTGGLIVRRAGQDIVIECDQDTTIAQLKRDIHAKTGLSTTRQRLLHFHGSPNPTVLSADQNLLSDYNIKPDNRTVITLKDLGWQVDWRTVFILEYFGPLLIHQLFVCSDGLLSRLQPVQLAVWAMVSAHYMKRLFESVFVHRFSHATMPATGMLKNCAHYWLVGGVWMARSVYFAPSHDMPLTIMQKALIVIFTLAELGNLYAHLKLRWLRPEGTKKRAIPHGFPFTLCSCPNYFFELIAWLCVAGMMPGLTVGWVFAIAGGVQMWLWAVKKHEQYVKEFPDYPRRSPMFPFTGF